MSNRSEGRRIAVGYGPGLSAAAVNALAERIDRAIGAAKKRGEERGAKKAAAGADKVYCRCGRRKCRPMAGVCHKCYQAIVLSIPGGSAECGPCGKVFR